MNLSDSGSTNRRFFRAPLDAPVTVIVAGQELIIDGEILDISRGGMRFAVKVDLPAGAPVVLRFQLPAASGDLLLRGRIVVSYFDAILERYAHGVVFTQYTQPDHTAIGDYVDGIEAISEFPKNP